MVARRPAERATAAGVVAFARELRRRGVEVAMPRVELALRALDHVDPRRRDEAYWALRCALTTDVEDVPAFDAAFAALWEGIGIGAEPGAPQPAELQPDTEPPAGDPSLDASRLAAGEPEERDSNEPGELEGEDEREAAVGVRWSAIERLRELDFRAYGPDELARAARLVAELARRLPQRRSRRLRPAPAGSRLDPRATLRAAMRTEGHPTRLAWRRATTRPRRLVFVIDVSGSMEPYARPLMMFAQAIRRASREVECFAFGTRLTRLTDELAARYPDAALERVSRAVPDWAGGTRIGENLKRLNDVWGRRGVLRGAVVTIVSDGWERGDLELLRTEMERLRRLARRIVWVNPLAGDPGYEPLAAGMATALPYVDRFLPGHNLRSIEALADVLAE